MHAETARWPKPEVRDRVVHTKRGPVDVLEAGEGRPVLYFHGTGAGSDIAAVMEHDLVAEGFHLIIPNRPGYYGTPLSCGRSPQTQADLAAEVLDRMDIERVAVVGTSGGGLAASCFAAQHAERTVALVLQCALSHPFTSPRWMPRHLRWLFPLFRYPQVFLPVLRFGFRREMRRLRRHPAGLLHDMCGSRAPELANDSALSDLVILIAESELQCAQQPAGIENDWFNAGGAPWLVPNSVHCPTLILHDRADPLVPSVHVNWALNCITHARHCDLDAGGHLIWVGNDAERMHAERTAFLRQHFNSANEAT